jgi:hypothetical protein
MLQNGARRKFDQGFEASLETSEPSPSGHVPFLRSASAMGFKSRPTDDSSERINERLALDYVDLECLLQEKLREFNVNMPIFRHGRYHNRRERPYERTNHASGDTSSAASTEDHDPNTAQIGGSELTQSTSFVSAQDYVKRIREAAFLFRLCQQEVNLKLQISTHCPERARLVEKTLQFYSTILDYFIDPLEQTKQSFDVLSRER